MSVSESDVRGVLELFGFSLKNFERLEGGRIDEVFLVEVCELDFKIVLKKVLGGGSEENVRKICEFEEFLGENGFLSARGVRSLEGECFVFSDGFFWKANEFIENDGIVLIDEERAFNVGRVLGEFHLFFKDFEDRERFDKGLNFDVEDFVVRGRGFVDEGLVECEDLRRVERVFEFVLGFEFDVGFETLVHGDPKLNNFLFCGGEVVGMVDLGSARVENCLYDLADGLRSWCKKDGVFFDEKIFEAGVFGYFAGVGEEFDLDVVRRMVAFVACKLSLRFFVDAFEGRLFRFDEGRGFESLKEQNLSDFRKYFEYFLNIYK